MIAFLKWLLLGHSHTYEIIERAHYVTRDGADEVAKGTLFTLKCTTCGKMKSFRDMG